MKVCVEGIHKMIFAVLWILLMTGFEERNGKLAIDGSIEYQSIEGWGVNQFIEWDWEGPDKRYFVPEKEVMYQLRNDLLIDDIHVYQGSLYEEENDDNDDFHYKLERYDYYFQKHFLSFGQQHTIGAMMPIITALWKMRKFVGLVSLMGS